MNDVAIIAYVPALHQGYINFFSNYSGSTYLLGTSLLAEQPRLDRDIRALSPNQVRQAVNALGISADVAVLEKSSIDKLLDERKKFILPDEDVSHQFANKYLEDRDVEFVTIFLRWDKRISTKEFEIEPNRTISHDELDREIMSTAILEAQKSPDWWRQVGSVLVKNSKIVFTAHNRPLSNPDYTVDAFGDPRSNFDAGDNIEVSKFLHSEAAIVAKAARSGIPLEGSTIYVTTFPCPGCARLIAEAGVSRVYYSQGYSLLDAEDIFKSYNIELILVQ